MIIQKEDRRKKLIENGVLPAFLDVIDDTSKFEDLKYIFKYPDSAYFYLPDIYPSYEILKGYDVTPICDGGNGDTFHMLLTRDDEVRFVHFELENDQIYNDYGNNFMLMFVDFLIEYYEFADQTSIETLIGYGIKMGFPKSTEIFNALEAADSNHLRKTFELDKQWRKDNVQNFL